MTAFAMVCGALAAWVWVSAPAAARLDGAPGPALPVWLRARDDALPRRARAVAGSVGALAVVLLVPGIVGVVVAVPVGLATFLALGRLRSPGADRQRDRLAAEAPECLDLMAACLDAGLPLRAAVDAVAAVAGSAMSTSLAAVAARVAVGQHEADAWRQVPADSPLAGVARDVARALASGTSLAPALRRQADDLRADRAAAVEARARSVGVRSVLPLMVCFLPAFLLVGVAPVVASVALELLR